MDSPEAFTHAAEAEYHATNEDESVDESVLVPGYREASQRIATYLITLQKPAGMDTKEFRKFKNYALHFRVLDCHFFRRNSRNVPCRRVIDNEADCQSILKSLHNESGRRGRKGTYKQIADQYWWERMEKDVKTYVQTCKQCQKQSKVTVEEALHPTWVSVMWSKVAVDVVHMPPCQGKHYLVVTREDLSGWVDVRALAKANSASVARFLWEDVICHHGVFSRLVVDRRDENKGEVIELTQRLGIKRLVISAFHPQANGMVERGHKPIVDALSKMTSGGIENWVENLPAVAWADCTTTRFSTGETPFYLNCRKEAVLPIEMDLPTWQILP